MLILLLSLCAFWPADWYGHYSSLDWAGLRSVSLPEGTTAGELASAAIALYGSGEGDPVSMAMEAIAADSADHRGWTALALVAMSSDSAFMDSLFSRARVLADGTDPVLSETTAYWLLTIGNPGEAAEFASTAIAADSMFGPGWFTLSLAYEDLGLFDMALEAAEQGSGRRPGSIALLHQYGQSLDNIGRFAEAEEAYREVIGLAPSRVSAWVDLGLLLSFEGRNGEAVKAFRGIVDLAPEYAWAWGELAALLEKTGRTDLADSCYTTALGIDPEDPWILYRLGRIRGRANPEDALALLEAAVAFDPDYSPAWEEMAFLYEMVDDFPSAEIALRKCLELDPSAWLSGELGWVLETMGKFGEAAEAYENSVAIDSLYLYGWQRRGALYVLEEDHAEAGRWYSLALSSLEAPDPWIMKNLGRIQILGSNADSALVLFSAAVELDSSDGTLRLDLAGALRTLGSYDEALAALDDALALGLDTSVAEAEKLVIMEMLGMETDSATAAALERWPRMWTGAGWYALEGNRKAHALDFARRAFALADKTPEQLIAVGDLYEALDRSDLKLACYREVAPLAFEDKQLAVSVSNHFFTRKLYREAIEILEQANLLFPNDLTLKTTLAEAHLFSDNLDMAEELLLQVLEIDPFSVYSICYLGLIEENRGNPHHATERYLEALRLSPGYPYAEARLRYIAGGDYDRAARRRAARKLQWDLWLDLSSTGGNIREQHYGGGAGLTLNYGRNGSSIDLSGRGRAEIRDGRDQRRTAWASLSLEHFVTDHLFAGASASWDRQPMTVRPWQVSSYAAAGWKSWPASWIWFSPEIGAGHVSTRWSTEQDVTGEWTVYSSLSAWARSSVEWFPSLWISGDVYIPPEDTQKLVAYLVGELEFSLPGPVSLVLGTSLDYTKTPVVETWKKLDSEIYLRLRL